MFNYLLYESGFGVYTKAEMVEIFGIENNRIFNIFTLVIFENTIKEESETCYLKEFSKILKNKKIKLGVKKRIINLETINKFFNTLKNNKKFILDKEVDTGNLRLLPEQYVQPNEVFSKIPLNNVLKNNFYNGCYILEFFDESKNNINFFGEQQNSLEVFSDKINKITGVSINLSQLPDRLGNIIFQFPINNLLIKTNSIKGESCHNNKMEFKGIEVYINYKYQNIDFNRFYLRTYEYNDDIILRQRKSTLNNNVFRIFIDDCHGELIEIIDIISGLVVFRFLFNILKGINVKSSIVGGVERIFKLDSKTTKVRLSYLHEYNQGKLKDDFNSIINNRVNKFELKVLEQSKSFVQYFDNDRNKAISDIRYLINKYSGRGIYLWDPYLSTDDIKNTLYFCPISNVPLRAITGLKQGKNKINVKNEMKSKFELDCKENLNIDLEVRGKLGNYGYDFHDRFLIFPLEKPRVWSLGISINQLGKSHHILQEVKHAQHILNTFNELWAKLDNEECLVWKS